MNVNTNDDDFEPLPVFNHGNNQLPHMDNSNRNGNRHHGIAEDDLLNDRQFQELMSLIANDDDRQQSDSCLVDAQDNNRKSHLLVDDVVVINNPAKTINATSGGTSSTIVQESGDVLDSVSTIVSRSCSGAKTNKVVQLSSSNHQHVKMDTIVTETNSKSMKKKQIVDGNKHLNPQGNLSTLPASTTNKNGGLSSSSPPAGGVAAGACESSGSTSRSSNNNTGSNLVDKTGDFSDGDGAKSNTFFKTKYFHDSQGDRWNQHLQELVKYRKVHCHCNVPFRPKTALAQWVKRQRHQYRLKLLGKHSTLTPKRQKVLDDIGFVWDAQMVAWEERFQELRAFNKFHGHCNVPSSYELNPKLAVWVKCQRRQHAKAHQENPLSPVLSDVTRQRYQRLTDLGFQWSYRGP